MRGDDHRTGIGVGGCEAHKDPAVLVVRRLAMIHRSLPIIVLSLALTASAADTNVVDKPYRYLYVSGPKLAKAPTIDGTVNADEWAGAGMAPRLYHIEEDRLMDLESKFYIGYTDEAVYL